MKRQLQLLSLAALMLTGCAGGGSSFNEKQQNFIVDSKDNFLNGMVVLSIASRTEIETAYQKIIETMTDKPTGDLAKAYWYDTARLSGTDLATAVYNVDKTGSFTVELDLKNGALNKYIPTEDGSECNNLKDDAYLQLYFVSANSKYKKLNNSNCNFVLQADYKQNTIPVSKTLDISLNKSSINANTNIPLVDDGIKHIFGKHISPFDFNNITDYKLTISGSYTASLEEN